MTDAQRMAIEDDLGIRLNKGQVVTDAQRMAIEARITQTARPQVSADAKYIVRWMVWIFVVLPAVAALIYFLSR